MLSIFRRLMARGGKDRSVCGEEGDSSAASQGNQESGEVLGCLEHEIAQLTKLQSGPQEHFGKAVAGKPGRHVSTVKMLASRESNFSGRGRFSKADSCHMLSRFLPVRGPTKVDQMRSRTYVSQFSSDGSLFVAGFQRSQIRIYNVEKGWRVQKDILARSMRWTITDTCLSSDQRFLVYSSMSPLAHIVNIESSTTESHANVTEIHDGLNFSVDDDDEDAFAIFSVKFSTDGRELVAATGDNAIYVYDLGANKLSLRIPAHSDDINTVCFADESGHLIYSGSDDSFVKVWDRRCHTSGGQTAAGVLTGHLEGITCIDSRGDGRYLISNGKDQCIKLWDIRKMTNNTSDRAHGYSGFDYRYMEYPLQAKKLKHHNDLSLGTYRGHGVLCTLIRCYFSPAYSTGQRYIYTGSSDCSAYIYDLVSGNQVAKLDYHEAPVRDCSWHPYYPMMVTSAWDGVIARWEFPGQEEPNNLPRLRKNRRRIHY